MTVLITGANGKLARHVIPLVEADGYQTVLMPRGDVNDINWLDRKIANLLKFGKIQAFVHLIGAYEPGFSQLATQRMYAANVATFVNVLGAIEQLNGFDAYPIIINIGAPFNLSRREQSADFSYFQSKQQLKEITQRLNGPNQYAVTIEPESSITTDDERDDIALRILDSINVPISFETLDQMEA